MEFQVFSNAPITEALLDIRVELPKEITLKEIELYHEHVKDRYPDKNERKSFRGGIIISVNGSEAIQPSGGPDGFLFKSANKEKIVQARLDGFTFNKLKPYEKWETMLAEAKELWKIYHGIFKPQRITRIALRYINLIEIPMPFRNLNEYLLTKPELAPGLPQTYDRMFMQIVVPNALLEANAIITQSIERPKENKLPYIFDIDAFKEYNYTIKESDMWRDFENLRQYKNEIFFNSITDKTKEMFK